MNGIRRRRARTRLASSLARSDLPTGVVGRCGGVGGRVDEGAETGGVAFGGGGGEAIDDGGDSLDTALDDRTDLASTPLSTLFLEGETLGAFVVAFDPSADRFFAAAFGAEALDVVVALALRRLAAEPVTEVFVFKAVLAEERRGRIE